ncbi:MAG: VTC domain-containing protein [Myxococcota bacterium]
MSGWRYERKFLVTDRSAQEVDCAVQLHPARFAETFPERHVNSLYLDWPDRRCFSDAQAGVADRVKYRARWYGDLFGRIEAPRLELKAKRGLVGSKRCFPLAPFSVGRGARLDELKRRVASSELPEDVRSRVGGLELALLTRYRRRYLASADGALRLTLDVELEFVAVHGGKNTFLRAAQDRRNTVVELKYAPEADDLGRWACSRFPFPVTKSSKYVRGIQLLEGG